MTEQLTSQEIREIERVEAIRRRISVIKAKLKRLDKVGKLHPSSGIHNQRALLNYELNNLGG